MYNKTTTLNQTKYYDIVAFDAIEENYRHVHYDALQKHSNYLLSYSKHVYLKAAYGIVSLNITDDVNNPVEEFMLHGVVKVHPGMLYFMLKITDDAKVDFYYDPSDVPTHHQLRSPLIIHDVKENLLLPQIYATYYLIKKAPYYFDYENHSYWEITVVNSGTLHTIINEKHYQLTKNNLIFYGPFQKHNQYVENDVCTYLTIMFDIFPIHRSLLNRVFSLDQRMVRLVEDLVRYADQPNDEIISELYINQLKELIILLLRDLQQDQHNRPSSTMRFNYESELFNHILEYINNNLYSNLQVSDLCKKFAVSRTTIQTIFKANLNLSPKQYIMNLKLKESKVLINEAKYTLSEIANILGYSSIHYFSRTFKEAFEMTPSQYSKSLVKK